MTDVNHNDSHNFNLMSVIRLLCKGWHITKGDATRIIIKNKSGGVIEFSIIIPMARGAIFACRFFWNVEIGAVSTDTETKLNIIKGYGLLGHINKDSTR